MEGKKTIGFVLGRETALCVAEIFAILTREEVKYEIDFFQPPILIISMTPKSCGFDIKELGGTIKIFDVIGFDLNNDEVQKVLFDMEVAQTEQRINFGISGYGKINQKLIYRLGKDLKNHYLEGGFKARFVTGKNIELSSVIVTENKLLSRGFELILVKNKELYTLGRTTAIQDYKNYGKRDFGRPKRDDRNGMLPPKVAQIMINLAQISKNSTLYDPFCGSGTVLQEAILSGYKNVFGSDINEKQIADTKDNLLWLEQIFCTETVDKSHLFVADAVTNSPEFQVDAITSESYLGEPGQKTIEVAESEIKELALFYGKVLQNFSKFLSKDGVVVLAVPFFIIKAKHYYLPIMDRLSGFTLQNQIPESIRVKMSPRGTLTYHRSDQFVGRELLVLKSNK